MKFGAGADDDPFVKVNDLTIDFSRLQAETSSEVNQKSHYDEKQPHSTLVSLAILNARSQMKPV